MNKKVSLKEIVAIQIVYACMLVTYYWMWSRLDWKPWYQIVQIILGWIFAGTIIFQAIRIQKYKKESVDEMAERNLKRCDSFCLKLLLVVMIVVAWGCVILGDGNEVGTVIINTGIIGWIIVLSILALSIIRTVMFMTLDIKGV
ncbi:MAG: hypothetical protein IJ655_09580 [Lachnospiraceae bacterium]|nr:hypothetical protein [Lachnospiraceae bacterium]